MKALIFNSGIGSRMGELTKNKPKCLLEIAPGVTILHLQITRLILCGIRSFVITTGLYDSIIKEAVNAKNYDAEFVFVNNPVYDSTNYIYSMYLAADYLDASDGVLMLHGDMVFDESVLRGLLLSGLKNAVVVNKGDFLSDKDFNAKVEDGIVTVIGTSVSGATNFLLPIYMLDAGGFRTWFDAVADFINNGKTKVYAEDAFNRVSEKIGLLPFYIDVDKDVCMEIDDLDDFMLCKNKDASCILNKKNRVFLVSGTLQAIMAVSLIKDAGNEHMYENYALIACLSVNKQHNKPIVRTIEGILRCGGFENICDFTDTETTVNALFQEERFPDCERLIQGAFAIEQVDELFIYDNSRGGVSVMTGRAFESAHIVTYGDGMGFIRSGIGAGYCHIDEIRTFIPIDYSKDFSDRIPLKIIDKSIFCECCEDYYNKNNEFKRSIEKYRELLPEDSAVLMLQQFTEFRRMDFDKEMAMYIKAVERNCEKGDTIALKSHPRETAVKRIEFLTKELNEKGFNVVDLGDPELKLMPIEMLCGFLSFKKVISTSSTAGISLKYLYDMDADIGVDEEDMRSYRKGREYFTIYMDGLVSALENLDTWTKNGPLYTYPKNPLNYELSAKSLAYITEGDVYCKMIDGYYAKNKKLSSFFVEKNIKNVALYGLSKPGRIIAEDLDQCDCINLHILDRSMCGETFLNRQVQYFDTLNAPIDCVFIAITHSLDEIKSVMKKHINCEKVFCLLDL